MDTMVLTGIGAAALGYVVYVAWRGVSGKADCGCGSGGACQEANGSCQCSSKSRPR